MWWFGADVAVELQRSRIRVIASTRSQSPTKDEARRFCPRVACNIHKTIVPVINNLHLILRHPCSGFATMPLANHDASEPPSKAKDEERRLDPPGVSSILDIILNPSNTSRSALSPPCVLFCYDVTGEPRCGRVTRENTETFTTYQDANAQIM